jgi:hypothetical protein
MGHAHSRLAQQPQAEDQSTDAEAVEDRPVRRGLMISLTDLVIKTNAKLY